MGVVGFACLARRAFPVNSRGMFAWVVCLFLLLVTSSADSLHTVELILIECCPPRGMLLEGALVFFVFAL